jgi:hypothetical protein
VVELSKLSEQLDVAQTSYAKDIVDLLSESDDDSDAESEVADFTDDISEVEEVQSQEDTLDSLIQEKLRDELKFNSDLASLHSRSSNKDIYGLTRGQFDTLSLTPMRLNDVELNSILQTKYFKLFYSLEWRASRTECEKNLEDCIYNLIWYEPFAAFICMQGRRPRVFVSFSPLLDLHMQPTQYEFLYAMYTMCSKPKFSCYVRNTVNNKIEFWNSKDGISVFKFLFNLFN